MYIIRSYNAYYTTADVGIVQRMENVPEQTESEEKEEPGCFRRVWRGIYNFFAGSPEITPASADNLEIKSVDDFKKSVKNIILGHVKNASWDEVTPTNSKSEKIEKLFTNIKTVFCERDENLETLISKILSRTTYAVDDPNNQFNAFNRYTNFKTQNNKMKSTVINAFKSLAIPIQQTLNDICYWVAKDNGIYVTKITLTDSDIHTRGVGVSIVEYKRKVSFWKTVNKKIVIKPEDKTFEKVVYGTQEKAQSAKSLAEHYNTLLGKKMLAGIDDKDGVGTLDIQLSENNAHGSAVEYVEHRQLQQVDEQEIDFGSVYALMAFSSLLGLSDLHRENAVYRKTHPGAKDRIQLLDAEVGGNYLLQDKLYVDEGKPPKQGRISPLKTSAKKGTMYKVNGGKDDSLSKNMLSNESLWAYDYKKIKGFLDTINQKLRGLSTRIVLIGTSNLYEMRYEYLTEDNPNDKEAVKIYKNCYKSTLEQGITSCGTTKINAQTTGDLDKCADSAIVDFQHGRIPFFTLDFKDGKVYQEVPENAVITPPMGVQPSAPGRIKVCTLTVKNSSANSSFLEGMKEHNRQILLNNLKELSGKSGPELLKSGIPQINNPADAAK